ncbi:MAG: PhzF family phenazine biosynthesis isomerase, partial [Defluviitaleaceae bacterium]|nr:PhzF family phenazine biosynthesis isomerase [Defluviitaleaceae bacterium]
MKFFQVDSFADALFRGNPAGVCVLQDGWISDSLMQSIAAEVNLSETVFVADIGGCLYLRWFTPTVEVDLCGHATLAAAHVLYHHLGYEGVLSFQSEHHQLSVYQKSDMLILDFPIDKIWQIPTAPDCVNISPIKYWRGTDEYIFVYEKESQIRAAVCDMEKAGKIDLSGIIITAP